MFFSLTVLLFYYGWNVLTEILANFLIQRGLCSVTGQTETDPKECV